MLLLGFVYQYKCDGCNATYYGKNKRYFKVRENDFLKFVNI